MITVENLSKNYDGKIAVRGLSLSIDRGEIFGLLGPNGAGKTTTVKLLTGMLLPTSGKLEVAGYDVLEQADEVKRRIGYVPESGAVFESLTAAEYLELIAELHHLDAALTRRRIEELLTLFAVNEARDTYLSRFSKGMRQKVLIAAALLHNPDVLFLDEPLNGLDANAAMVVKELLRKLAAQGKTIMFCSHILEVVERICTRIAVIDRGEIVALGSPGELIEQTKTPSLEHAFHSLTGNDDVDFSAQEIIRALQSV